MNVNASEATLRAVTEALKLGALLDPRLPRPDKASIAAMAEQIERYRLNEADLLDAVRNYYDHPSDRPIGIGDLITIARAIHQERALREHRAAEQAAEDAYDPALAARNKTRLDEICASIGATRSVDEALKYQRPTFNPLRVACPHCRASIGRLCTSGVNRMPLHHEPRYHDSRLRAAETIETSCRREVSVVVVADRQCGCGRDIFDNADACDRCQPVIDGPNRQPNGNTNTA